MSTKKVIQIKPELFKLSSSKTKTIRNRSGTPKIDISKLKNQLSENILKRKNAKEKIKKKELEIKSEFEKSFNFMLQESEKSSKGGTSSSSLHNKSIRSRPSHHIPNPNISLETPSTDFHEVELNNEPDSALSYKLDNSIRYGCLKNGLKKTYKNLSNTSSRSNGVRFKDVSESSNEPISNLQNIIDAPIIGTPTPQITEISVPLQPVITDISTITQNTHPLVETVNSSPDISNKLDNMKTVSFTDGMENINISTSNGGAKGGEYVKTNINGSEEEMKPVIIESIPIKPLTKEELIKVPSIKEIHKRKTIVKHYKLGKHKTIKNRVSVLCNNKDRIDKIKQSQRELQKTSMEEMKKYLMTRNLLRSGSVAPPDVIKKLYESAYLAADITNIDDDVLLENYMDK
jgi:hypothetical protein